MAMDVDLVALKALFSDGRTSVESMIKTIEDAVLEAWEDKPTLLAFVPVDR
jgi:hypothetical protein